MNRYIYVWAWPAPGVARGSYLTPSRSQAPAYALQGYLAHKKTPTP